MSFAAKILADSVSRFGFRLTTFEVTFPRIVLAEFNTHRMLSRNSASSRAIPIEKMLRLVNGNPYIPSKWGRNQKGMQAYEEILGEDALLCEKNWLLARDMMVEQVQKLSKIGLHKQTTNRLLEPFMWHTAIITATDWDNLWHLRDHAAAHPDIRTPVHMMLELFDQSDPQLLEDGVWHTPLIFDKDYEELSMDDLVKVSIGRCARVSYLTHDGRRSIEEDLGMLEKLEGPGHMSPLEHSARPMDEKELELFATPELIWDADNKEWFNTGETKHYLGNFEGWVQYRKLIPGEWDILGYRALGEE